MRMGSLEEENMRLRSEIKELRKRIYRYRAGSIFDGDLPDEYIMIEAAKALADSMSTVFLQSMSNPHYPMWDYSVTYNSELRTKITHAECALIVPSVFF